MSLIKRHLENVSVDLGFDGEINDEVIERAAALEAARPGPCGLSQRQWQIVQSALVQYKTYLEEGGNIWDGDGPFPEPEDVDEIVQVLSSH